MNLATATQSVSIQYNVGISNESSESRTSDWEWALEYSMSQGYSFMGAEGEIGMSASA